MAHLLPDEILHIILSAGLYIPDDQLFSDSLKTFGGNTCVSSASALLVCKRWSRVGIPCLYEAVVLRTAAQVKSLKANLIQAPSLGRHIKRIRIEDAYVGLLHVLQACSALDTLSVNINVTSSAPITDLSRGLLLVNPTRVALLDPNPTFDNKKTSALFNVIRDTVTGHWTNMIHFHVPPRFGYRKEDKSRPLAVALCQSKSLLWIHAEVTEIKSRFWITLIQSKSLRFKFYGELTNLIFSDHSSLSDRLRTDPIFYERVNLTDVDLRSWSMCPIEARAMAFKLPAHKDPHKDVPQPSQPISLDFTLLSESLWEKILSFAAIRSLTNQTTASAVNKTRKSLLVVSKMFHRITESIVFHTPVFLSAKSLSKFTLMYKDSTRLSTVDTLALWCLFSPHGEELAFINGVEECLLFLLPKMRSLREFVGGYDLVFRPEVFSLLAKYAGSSLRSITYLQLSDSGTLTSRTLGQLQSLVHFECLKMDADFKHSQQVSTSILPSLSTLKLPLNNYSAWEFLRLGGQQIRQLDILGFTPYDDCVDSTSEVTTLWKFCPKLETIWSNIQEFGDIFSDTSPHQVLKKIRIEVVGFRATQSKKLADPIFLPLLEAARTNQFPALREVILEYYQWPVVERDILRDYFVKHALSLHKIAPHIQVFDDCGQLLRMRANLQNLK